MLHDKSMQLAVHNQYGVFFHNKDIRTRTLIKTHVALMPGADFALFFDTPARPLFSPYKLQSYVKNHILENGIKNPDLGGTDGYFLILVAPNPLMRVLMVWLMQQVERELQKMGCKPSVPVVFIGQQLIGGPNQVMTLQVRNQLAPLLIRAGAIWI
ncbi:hypothetical protein V6N13_004688 [Hibiscus sabdariffa]|uniref:Uncharacterized protein n=1 Tax=Hibiscus sabdariffa TaxID=183260 RepID=A0ABR2RZI6_9ROSI